MLSLALFFIVDLYDSRLLCLFHQNYDFLSGSCTTNECVSALRESFFYLQAIFTLYSFCTFGAYTAPQQPASIEGFLGADSSASMGAGIHAEVGNIVLSQLFFESQ